MIHQLDAAASGAPARPARGCAALPTVRPARQPPAPIRPPGDARARATPHAEWVGASLSAGGAASHLVQTGVGRAQSADGAILVPRWRRGVTLMIEITSFCRYARECEISHFFISREIHCEVKCEMSWRFHCEITFPVYV